MPTQVQFRRGTTAQNNSFTGAAGEISINTSNSTIRVHDGSTAGGTELATRSFASDAGNLTTGTLSSARLATSGVSASTYGNASIIPVITVDTYGRITSASNVAVAASGGGGGGAFNTAVNRNVGYELTTTSAAAFTAPSTAGIEYIIHSIHVTNISAANTAEVSGSFDGTTYSGNISFSNTVPVPVGTSVELLKRPKVLQPSDKIQLSSNAAASLHAVITYETQNSTSYFGSGVDVTSAASYTTLYTATANSMIESILLSNDDGTNDVKARVVWTNASDTIQGYYAYDLIVPADATVELLEAPKYLENGHKVRVYANQANRLEAIISGKSA